MAHVSSVVLPPFATHSHFSLSRVTSGSTGAVYHFRYEVL
jgi:hypothetical protein